MDNMSLKYYMIDMAKKAKESSRFLRTASTDLKDTALLNISNDLLENEKSILDANKIDMDNAAKNGLSSTMLDRLLLNSKRIRDIAESVKQTSLLPDPIGEVIKMWKRPNGLKIGQIRVPIGVIGIIYEARPNVTVDAAVLCLKSGNPVILRGGSEAFHTNTVLAEILRKAVSRSGIPEDSIQFINTAERDAVNEMMKLNGYIDLLIPRGGRGLIQTVVKNSTIPVIETGVGNCHVYVDKSADFNMAESIIINAKTQRPAVCNAMETLLVHSDAAEEFIPQIAAALSSKGVEMKVCERTLKILQKLEISSKLIFSPASEEDWETEYLDLKLAVRIVDSLDQALEHIYKYGTGHSECIVTNNYKNSQRFLNEIDAAAVYVNASTRFTDGFEFGFGAEIGISTQKLHARGPMGLEQLTSTKYIVYGDGQIRK